MVIVTFDFNLIFAMIVLLAILSAIIIFLCRKIIKMRQQLKELQSTKQSQSTRYGQIFEELIPFSSQFPGDPKQFRFIGDPIDGILFGEDSVKFVEIKMADSKLNVRQKRIKELVEQKKVRWVEIRG